MTPTWQAAPGRYETMPYRRCGTSGLKLPALSLGLWHNFGDTTPLSVQREMATTAFDLGITHFDLANNYGPPYGSAEINFGRLLREDFRPYRDELIISTKAGWDMWPGPYGQGGGSRKYVLASLDQSLKRLGLDYVDIFYSHRFDKDTPLAETAGALAQGLLSDKYLNGIPADARVNRPGGGSLMREHLSEANLARVRALHAIAQRRGQSLAQMALAWVLRDPRVTTTLIGASSAAQIRENVAALQNLHFSAEELAEIDAHAQDGGVDLWRAPNTDWA